MAESPITFIILLSTGIVSWRALEQPTLFQKLLQHPYSVKHNKEYYRLFSHMLVHSGLGHLFLNLFVFYSFGSLVEQTFLMHYGVLLGSIVFLALYILGGLAATIPSMRKHADDYGYSAVGASGAVSAVLMAFMIMYPTVEILFFFIIPMPGFIAVFVFFLLERMMQKRLKTNIAHDAHIWGALFGVVFVALLDINYLVEFVNQVKGYILSLFH